MRESETIGRLIAAFTKLPSVGTRTAYRYTYAIMNMPESDVREFAELLVDVKTKVHYCKLCGNYTENEVCDICSTRDSATICVVGEPKDVIAIENTDNYHGVYHILGGYINPRSKIGPTELRINELLSRLNGVQEVILATNPSPEGEVTAMYIAGLLKPLNIKVTRIAFGVPVGSNIEYADEVTLGRALNDRKEI